MPSSPVVFGHDLATSILAGVDTLIAQYSVANPALLAGAAAESTSMQHLLSSIDPAAANALAQLDGALALFVERLGVRSVHPRFRLNWTLVAKDA
ncbi:hypothetical protein [Paraburkholderia sp. GAS42]|uniref:hypothetical protein n=1 Tax=Paraburkholderia sp. GAS42 TaxID=3035135 RepID=UPI003D21C93E